MKQRAPLRWAGLLVAAMTTAALAADNWRETLPFDLNGFIDGRAGTRLREDPYEDDLSLGELRLQLDAGYDADWGTLRLRTDVLYDAVPDTHDVDLTEGTGWLDLRELNVLLYPTSLTDLKIGRQILTWGSGDLVFINDLFPKDWRSFFNGRDEEYLKAPSDALMLSLFPGATSIDVVYTPRFNADRYIRGDRISYWNPMLGETAGQNAIIDPLRPDETFEDDEWSARVYQTVRGVELAAYGYYGFWKSPVGFDQAAGQATFPELAVWGASARAPWGAALVNAEAGYYDSLDDRNGTDPTMPNSEIRVLLGGERELVKNLTAGLQYYVEWLMNYDDYLAGVMDPATARDEDRHLLTLRLTKRALNQTLTLSLFTYYSPSDEDAYLRPIAKYKLTDNWLVTAGANLFYGREPHTFFGQFENNNNVYAGARYSF